MSATPIQSKNKKPQRPSIKTLQFNKGKTEEKQESKRKIVITVKRSATIVNQEEVDYFSWIPKDIWIEILLFCQEQQFVLMKCVSKEWNSVITTFLNGNNIARIPNGLRKNFEQTEINAGQYNLKLWHTRKDFYLFMKDFENRDDFEKLGFKPSIINRWQNPYFFSIKTYRYDNFRMALEIKAFKVAKYILEDLKDFIEKDQSKEKPSEKIHILFECAIKGGNLKFFKYVIQWFRNIDWKPNMKKIISKILIDGSVALESGNLELVKYLLENIDEHQLNIYWTTWFYSAVKGGLEMVKFIYDKPNQEFSDQNSKDFYDEALIRFACETDLEITKFVWEKLNHNLELWKQACYYACKNLNIETLVFLMENCKLGFQSSHRWFYPVIEKNNVKMMQYILKNYNIYSDKIHYCFQIAIEYLAFDMLQFLHKKFSCQYDKNKLIEQATKYLDDSVYPLCRTKQILEYIEKRM